MDNSFKIRLQTLGIELIKKKIDVLQINVGKKCNLGCFHCHVDAGPGKTEENMSLATEKSVVKLMDCMDISTVDITGGAPELNPNFHFLVNEARKRGLHVIDRCNLCVLFEPGQENMADFLAANNVEIVASLPCYTKNNVDKQRGKGVFEKSIDALHLLNKIGYAQEGTGLLLNLVFNPAGASLPPPQKKLEKDYKEKLFKEFGIVFNDLYTMTNMPVSRYKKYLRKLKLYDGYIDLLANSFNPNVIPDLMCRNTLSISWDGKLYDCDFNQMLGMRLNNGKAPDIFNFSSDKLKDFRILTGNHCFGCTAGSGSGCQGILKNA